MGEPLAVNVMSTVTVSPGFPVAAIAVLAHRASISSAQTRTRNFFILLPPTPSCNLFIMAFAIISRLRPSR